MVGIDASACCVWIPRGMFEPNLAQAFGRPDLFDLVHRLTQATLDSCPVACVPCVACRCTTIARSRGGPRSERRPFGTRSFRAARNLEPALPETKVRTAAPRQPRNRSLSCASLSLHLPFPSAPAPTATLSCCKIERLHRPFSSGRGSTAPERGDRRGRRWRERGNVCIHLRGN